MRNVTVDYSPFLKNFDNTKNEADFKIVGIGEILLNMADTDSLLSVTFIQNKVILVHLILS